MALGIRAKLTAASIALIGVSVAASELWLVGAIEERLTAGVQEDLFVRATLVAWSAETLAATGPGSARAPGGAWDGLADDLGVRARARVTLIAANGAVLGDSDVDGPAIAAVENHAGRPEVAAALASGRGIDVRLSATIGVRLMYVAVPLGGAAATGVARVALPLSEVDAALGAFRRTVWLGAALALAIAVLLSSIAAHLASRAVRQLTGAARRMAGGDLGTRTRTTGSDEVAALGQALDRLAEGLSASLGELRSERDLVRGILEGMQEGVLVVDGGGRIVLVNPTLREMLLLGADASGKPVLEVIRRAELKELLDRARSDRAAATAELEVGGLRPRRLLVHAAALAGDPTSLVVVFVDVTDLRRLESLRREFVANVSHELRTPVASIRSAVETLQAGAASDPATSARFLDIVDRNGERLHHLLEDLLDLSRIEAREYRLAREPIDLAGFAAHVVSLFRERADKRRIALETAVPANMPPVKADRRALEQVLANLVENALKYCPEGARVTLRGETAGEASVRIAVEDTGPGVEARHLPRLFERFYRVDAGRSRDLGGTGLGLSIVKHLCEAMGGTVGVESEAGRGTKFTVTLPRA